MSVTPDSCWPYDFATGFASRPRAVVLAEVQPLDANGRPDGNAFVAAQAPQWDFVSKGGKPHIRIKNIPGLAAGKYRVTVLVVKE